jgi:hypothetical protein
MKQQIPVWAIIAAAIAALAIIGFLVLRASGTLDNDGHGTITPEDMAKHRQQQQQSYGKGAGSAMGAGGVQRGPNGQR